MKFTRYEQFRKEREAEGKEVLEENLLEHIYGVEAKDRKFSEREKRALLFLLMTDGLRLLLDKLGVSVEHARLQETLAALMENEKELWFLLADEMYATLSEASEVFDIKRSRLMTATMYNHVPTVDIIGAFYNYSGKGARKLKHVRLPDVGRWLKTREDLLNERDEKDE